MSPKDFAFLQEAIAECDALPGKTLYSGKFSEVSVLIAKAIRASGGIFSGKTEKFLRQFRGKLDESLVIRVLRLVYVLELGGLMKHKRYL